MSVCMRVVQEGKGGRRGLCIVFSMAPNFNSGSVSLLAIYETASSRPACSPPLKPVHARKAHRMPRGRAGRRQVGHLANSHTASRISFPPAVPGQSSNYRFWPSYTTSSHSTVVVKFKLIFHHSLT